MAEEMLGLRGFMETTSDVDLRRELVDFVAGLPLRACA
jgi:hypothetical protein